MPRETMRYNSGNSYSAILLCGGEGTRLADVRRDTPKPLFKIEGRELIRYTIDILDPSIVTELVFAVGYKRDEVMAWINSANLPFEVKFSEDPRPGIPRAVRTALSEIEGNNIIVCNTDEIRINFDLPDAVQYHEEHGLPATLVATFMRNVYVHAKLDVEEDRTITNITRYPIDLVDTSFFLMRRSAADYFNLQDTTGSYGISVPLIEARRVKAYIAENMYYFNINTKEDVETIEAFLKQKDGD